MPCLLSTSAEKETIFPLCLFLSLQLGTVTLAGWLAVGWLVVSRVCKMGSERRRPRVACLSVCLSVCILDYSKSYDRIYDRKFVWRDMGWPKDRMIRFWWRCEWSVSGSLSNFSDY